jgi:hypothetical protein
MKDRGYREFDREKKIKKVEKNNKVVKHRKNIYNYDVEDDLDDDFEQYLDEVKQYKDTK